MYKIIGGDNHEYGPVSAEQSRQWIVEGRASAQTKVQVEGGTEWMTLSEQPEFSASLSGTGIFVTLPIGFASLACAYEDIFGTPTTAETV